jgi:hypothetical protein
VYFPRATWYDFKTGRAVPERGACQTVPAPLAQIPIFVREGALIPRWPRPPCHLKQPDLGQRLWVDLYAGPAHKRLEWTVQGRRIVLDYMMKRGIGRLVVEADSLDLGLGLVGFAGVKIGPELRGAVRPAPRGQALCLRCQVRGQRTLTFWVPSGA